ncbi:MAG: hypothetical protein PHE73_08800 [Sulfurovaceae bacterium]|nr:hypothetical protein [Sulfurovaceae bacterium]
MAKTLTNLRTGVRVYLDEASQADFLDSEVDRSINYAYHNLISRIVTIYENFYETPNSGVFSYATVANQQEYVIDPTLVKVTRVEINYNPGSSSSISLRAIPIKTDEAQLNLSNSAYSGSSFNSGYYLRGSLSNQVIGFIPIPTVSDIGNTKSISVWGIVLPTDLVNGTDAVNIPYVDNFSHLIELKAASILLSKGQQEEVTASKYVQEYEFGVKMMMEFLHARQADGVWMIQDVEAENLDFGMF